MPTRERTEKVRQQIMRMNELLGIMRGRLTTGERAYEALFAGIPPEERARTHKKDLQWQVAEQLEDLAPLKDAVGELHFGARELERAFAELSGIIAATPDFWD